MYKSDNQSVEAFFDFLAVNPSLMVFICIATPFLGITVWSLFQKDETTQKPKPRHLRTKASVPVRAYRLDQASQDDMDFEKITFWYNEIGNDTKELVS